MNLFNSSITTRYNTVERNIKSKSNSFYDSYLDLLEATIKHILDENNIEYDNSRTCGYLIRDEYIKSFFLYLLKLDDYTYNKIPDYIKKCNDHKHKKEKYVSIEAVINYLKVYFDLINYYSLYKNLGYYNFDASYYESIFGETERLNEKYRDEVSKLKKELDLLYESDKLSKKDIDLYKSIIDRKDFELMNLDEQNQILQNQLSVLKDIKINSLEEKIQSTIDNLHEFGLTIRNNVIVKEIINSSDVNIAEVNVSEVKKPINDAVSKTKKFVDDSNQYIKKGKEEFGRINDEISSFIESLKNKD